MNQSKENKMYCRYEEGIWKKGEDGWKKAMTEELISSFENCKTEEEINDNVESAIETAWQMTGIEFDEFEIASEAVSRYVEQELKGEEDEKMDIEAFTNHVRRESEKQKMKEDKWLKKAKSFTSVGLYNEYGSCYGTEFVALASNEGEYTLEDVEDELSEYLAQPHQDVWQQTRFNKFGKIFENLAELEAFLNQD